MTLGRRQLGLGAAALTLGWATAAPARESLRKQLQQIHARGDTHAARIAAVSKLFLGRPYQLSPLGEGPDGTATPIRLRCSIASTVSPTWKR